MSEKDGSLQKFWFDQVKDYRSSGLGRAAYCRKHNLKTHNLSYWVRRSQETKTSRFVAVQVDPVSANSTLVGSDSKDVRLILRDGTIIEAREGSMSAVAKLLTMLRSYTK